MLWEVTGFEGDAAVMDAVFVVVEAWAVQMAEGLAASPPVVREGHVHLLMQQAELLLDSAGRLAQAIQLAEHVTFLTGMTDGMITRLDELIKDRPRSLTSAEIYAPVPEPERDVQAIKDAVLADWEADLLAGKDYSLPESALATEPIVSPRGNVYQPGEPVLSKQMREEVLAVLPEKKQRRRDDRVILLGSDGEEFLECYGCGRELPTGSFFRNQKSQLGYETRCRSCRRPSRAAA